MQFFYKLISQLVTVLNGCKNKDYLRYVIFGIPKFYIKKRKIPNFGAKQTDFASNRRRISTKTAYFDTHLLTKEEKKQLLHF